MDIKIGDKILIVSMDGEPSYSGRIGVVDYIDDIGQLHGSWGSLAVNPDIDIFEVISSKNA